MSLGIASSGMAPAQITWLDIASWSRVMDVPLSAWEARALVILGRLRAGIESEKMAAQSKAAKP